MCGGTEESVAVGFGTNGLSPRVRGNPVTSLFPTGKDRSIPACAGEPELRLVVDRRPEVYPRVCGGTCRTQITIPQTRGLSPRVRGNPLGLRPFSLFSRSIPACAGEPIAEQYGQRPPAVYPRVRGGTDFECIRKLIYHGLPPRARGNLRLRDQDGDWHRSIPACAGEPLPSSAISSGSRVYPRVCGGTQSCIMLCLDQTGLSPRVRGNQAHTARHRCH